MVSKFSSRLNPKFRSLVLDNDETYFEDIIYGSFKIDIMDLISIKAQLSNSFHIQPSEIDKMPFWELELYLKELERIVKEEKEQNEAEMKKSGIDDAKRLAKPGNIEKMMNSQSAKMPSMPKMPTSFNMPSYK